MVNAMLVTCNYDGSAKHKTIIEDGAFIGSDTMLVAPVRVGKGAATGAGSVVTGDVAAGEKVAGGELFHLRRLGREELERDAWRPGVEIADRVGAEEAARGRPWSIGGQVVHPGTRSTRAAAACGRVANN